MLQMFKLSKASNVKARTQAICETPDPLGARWRRLVLTIGPADRSGDGLQGREQVGVFELMCRRRTISDQSGGVILAGRGRGGKRGVPAGAQVHPCRVAVHPPRRRQLLPPSPQEQARCAEQAAAWRAERDRRDAELRPSRLAAVCAGPPVRDPDAAADCHCSCHPKPADAELHDGGLSCGCQLTPEELGVTAQWRGVAAPFVITGNADGRGFYLRERHGYYRVTIAPDDDPAADPWELPAERATLDIADGEDDDLTGPDGGYDVAHALIVAVHAVRTFLARRECEHQQPTDPRQLFCAWCGVRLAEADKWTADMDAEHGEPTA